MYAVCVTFKIHPKQMEDFLPLMIANARTSRAEEAGCQMFDVCVRDDEVLLYEIYDDRAAFELHLASAHFKTFDASVAHMVVSKQVALFDEVIR
ncbi:putative quinol monooxygenase [Shimia sp. MIT1388]|uniref:putative quinol monooxygenase n=1 Tax=Shimia sp. MIT1388 TaxID=3096992 RepID=UPI00399B1A3B